MTRVVVLVVPTVDGADETMTVFFFFVGAGASDFVSTSIFSAGFSDSGY